MALPVKEAVEWRWPGSAQGLIVVDDVVTRWDGPGGRPSNTEISQAVTDYTPTGALSDRSLASSRHKDKLADCAMWVRERNITAWNAMTNPQKVTAVLAAADLWKSFREFIDDKV